MDTQTQIDRLIELAIIQRSELKQLVEQLPQLREHLNAEVEKVFEETEPQLRSELEEWTTKQTADKTAALGVALEAKIANLAKSLEISTQARYSAIIAEREENARLAAQAEAKIAEHAASLPSAVKEIVSAELARFPRAGEIDQLRKEFAEPRGLNPRGKWQAGETYNRLDLVTYNGDSFVSNIDGNTEKPSRNAANWTLNAARGVGGGGGGVTSLTDLVPVPSNGQLLIGNGSAFVNNTLTAGTGVTITNGAGTITIDASGAQETLTATVTNAESIAITRGQVVYLFGATGNRASVKLASNTADATSAKTFGVVSDASIAAGGVGVVTCVGVVDKLNLGAYNEGDTLYLGATAGSVTATKPYAPNHLVYVGIVERANNGNGELYVRVQNGYELDEIHDVQINAPKLAGQTLIYDQTNDLWKNARLTGTANQITVTNADAAVTLSIPTNPTLPGNLTVSGTGTSTFGGNLTVSGGTITGGTSGLSLASGGTNQNITLTPSGTGATVISKAETNTNAITTVLNYIKIQNTSSGGTYIGALEFYTWDNRRAAGIFANRNNVDGTSGVLSFAYSTSGNSFAEGFRLNYTGNLLLGTTTDSGNGKLQLATHTTSAGGIGFGTDVNLFRNTTSQLRFSSGSSYGVFQIQGASGSYVDFYATDGTTRNGSVGTEQAGTMYVGTRVAASTIFLTNSTTALTLDSSQRTILSGALRLNNAYTASAVVPTGYVTIQDSTGTTYKVCVLL